MAGKYQVASPEVQVPGDRIRQALLCSLQARFQRAVQPAWQGGAQACSGGGRAAQSRHDVEAATCRKTSSPQLLMTPCLVSGVLTSPTVQTCLQEAINLYSLTASAGMRAAVGHLQHCGDTVVRGALIETVHPGQAPQ